MKPIQFRSEANSKSKWALLSSQQVCKHTLDALPFALTAFCFDTSQKYNNFVSKEWSEHLFSWLVKSECLLNGQNLMQTAFRLVKQECLLIGQAKVPPDWLKYRVPLPWLNCNVISLDWLSQNASWLVNPECVLIGLLIAQARVPPDWLIQSASRLVEL